MKQVFFTSAAPLQRWLQAFPELSVCSDLEVLSKDDLVWLDCLHYRENLEVLLADMQNRGIRCVAMESMLSDERGLWYLQRGVCGYAHRHAAPEQLVDIALVVSSGGVWMGQDLLQRALKASLTVARELAIDERDTAVATSTSELTERELAVAREVGKGASNREIAETLQVSERTVKAHLSVVFEKMQVRDRVQLALLMNNVQI